MLLSFTTDRKRENSIKRIIQLDTINTSNVKYTMVRKVVLFKVVLRLNGLKSSIIIYKK